MVVPLSRTQRGLFIGAVLGVTGLPVAADAHPSTQLTTLTGTVQYGWGGTAGNAFGNTSLTMEALKQSGCTSTKLQGQEMNGFDAAVIPVTEFPDHTVRLTWTHKGNTGNTGRAGTWVYFVDATCKLVAVPKSPVNAQYLTDRTFVVPKTGVKWIILEPETGQPGIDWKMVIKHPAPKKPKPKPKR